MPHSNFKEGFHQNGLGMVKCPCGQTFDFASERDWKMKHWLHRKFCTNPPEARQIRVPKKAMTLREHHNNEIEKIQRVHENH